MVPLCNNTVIAKERHRAPFFQSGDERSNFGPREDFGNNVICSRFCGLKLKVAGLIVNDHFWIFRELVHLRKVGRGDL